MKSEDRGQRSEVSASAEASAEAEDHRYRKKPVVVRAWQWNGEQPHAWPAWVFDYRHDDEIVVFNTSDGILLVPTLEGRVTARSGDWIIQGVQGELYPCKPDIFEATYERADGACGVVLIAAERRRQVYEEGWSVERDDLHTEGELAKAGACYALSGSGIDLTKVPSWHVWPWDLSWWKPKTLSRDLVRAGALIAAEIDRLLRLDAASVDEDPARPGLEWEPEA